MASRKDGPANVESWLMPSDDNDEKMMYVTAAQERGELDLSGAVDL